MDFHHRVEDTIRLMKTAISSGGLDVTPLKKLLDMTIDENKIRKSHMDFGIVAFLLTDRKPVIMFKEDITEGEMLDYLLASASLPGFKPMEIDYYDAMKVFGRYKGRYYYLTDTANHIKLDESHIRQVYDFLGIDWDKRFSPQNRLITYKLIRALKNYSSERRFRNTDVIISAAAEISAEVMGIDRCREYSLNDLIDIIIEQYNSKKADIALADFSKIIDEDIWSINENSFTDKMKEIISESKFAALYSTDINDLSDRAVLYRRLLALAFPKICITNIFIALMMIKR